MLKREIPHHAKEGRVIRVSRSHIAPAPLTGELTPLQPLQPWSEQMQPLCYWHDEPVALLVEKRIPIVTTFAPLVQQSQPEIARRFGIPEWKIEERQKAVADPARYEGLVRAAQAGVAIVFGTDAGSPAVEHDVIAPELAHMVKVGVCTDNMDALASITIRAARLSRMDHLVGTLEVDKAADLIVVDGRPDDDLGALGVRSSRFTEGGYCTLFREGMRLKGRGGAEDLIAAACAKVYDDEFGHMLEGIAGLDEEGWSDNEFRLMGKLVIAQLRLRIHMRNAEFSYPLTEKRIQAIFDGEIEPEKFDFQRAEEALA